MDAAMFRRGGLWKPVYVPLPSPDERGMILKALARKKPIDANVDLMALGKHSGCDKFSGADLSALVSPFFLFFYLFCPTESKQKECNSLMRDNFDCVFCFNPTLDG